MKTMLNCSCFSMCDSFATTLFLSQIPLYVTNKYSPWFAYLKAVYLDVKLPFKLHDLNFFYHNDHHWQINHPTVSWPMSSCQLPHNHASNVPEKNGIYKKLMQQKCPIEECKAWFTEKPRKVEDFTTSYLKNYDSTTRGI